MQRTESPLVSKIGAFVELTPDEKSYLARLESKRISVKPGRDLVHEGETNQTAYIFESGWACSYKILPDGGRQIISFPIPGDCVGLRSMLLRTADHSLSTVTESVVVPVDAPHINEMLRDFPYLGAALLWATSRDEAMIVEHLVSVGRRSATERTAHLILELHDRLLMVGLAAGGEFDCPLSQNILADTLGLSTIHINRVLRRLRTLDLVSLRSRKLKIHDLAGLKALAGYSSPVENLMLTRNRH